jgi:tol-pal system protein YbgF
VLTARPGRIAALAIAGTLAACGGGQERVQAQLDTMQHQLQALNEQAQANDRRLTRLQDRIDLLEDKIEAQAIHGVPSGLPVVRVRPAQPAEGAARRGDEPPPLEITQADLDRMDGGEERPADEAPVHRGRPRAPVPPPENASGAANLGVVPLPPKAAAAADAAADAPADDDPVGAYKRAYALYKAGDLGAALTAFQGFVDRWPKHDYTDNALYWMGECRYDRAEFAAALQLFKRVVDEHPAGNKVPDALLMVGLTLGKLGRPAEGRDTLARLVALFPDTEAAHRAASELGQAEGRL